jgi:hypothetical protein
MPKVLSLQKIIDKVDNTINEKGGIRERLSKIEGGVERDRVHNGLAKTQSPLSITDKGFRALLESGGMDYINANKSSLIQRIKDQHPKTAYDVQELSISLIREQKDTDDFMKIKDYTFYNGLELESIILTIAVYVRDLVLTEM